MRLRFVRQMVIVMSLVLLGAGTAGSETSEDRPIVVVSTTLGDLTIELYPDKAPITVKNFLSYVEAHFYTGTIFHRILPGTIIQGGGLTEKMKLKRTQRPIRNEADNGLKNGRGTVAMARTQDINSATSQFFINLKDTESLDHGVRGFGYAVFGRVIEGMDVADKIASLPTGKRGRYKNVPLEPVVIRSVRQK